MGGHAKRGPSVRHLVPSPWLETPSAGGRRVTLHAACVLLVVFRKLSSGHDPDLLVFWSRTTSKAECLGRGKPAGRPKSVRSVSSPSAPFPRGQGLGVDRVPRWHGPLGWGSLQKAQPSPVAQSCLSSVGLWE